MPLSQPCLPEHRRPMLGTALADARLLRAIECHSPLSAMLGAAAVGAAGQRFDALWVSGFAKATSMGLPDAELTLLERRLDSVADIAAVTSLPLIVDADTGGDELAFLQLCRRLDALGVSAVVVEDKTGAKRTSLADGVVHRLEDPDAFIQKIATAKARVLSPDFLIFARIESLIAGAGLQDALRRAAIYLQGPADALVVHSKDKSGDDVFAFMDGYGALQLRLGIRKPLVLIPTAYNHVTGAQLHVRGAAIVIHANHMVRAAFRAMRHTAEMLLEHDRSLEVDGICAPVADLLDATGYGHER